MLPILFQNVISNFVSMLDNIMVGRIGTEEMSGVAIVNQLMFVFNVCLFGGITGTGIFTAQYFGKGDMEGIKNSMRAKAWVGLLICLIFGCAFVIFGTELLSLFIHEGEDTINLEATLEYGIKYLRIIIIQIPLFTAVSIYSSTLRETGDAKLPMRASLIAVLVNLVFNWILIFGKFGAPKLGVEGAAIATVISRVVEISILIIKTGGRYKGVWTTLRIPSKLAIDVIKKAIPLLGNELLWASGMTGLVQILSVRGIEVVSAENICTTISNLFYCSYLAMGSTIAIVVGQHLGAGRLEQAVDEDNKLIFTAVVISAVCGLIMMVIAPFMPKLYNTTDMVKSLATKFFLIAAAFMPSNAFINSCYFTLRSGGKVISTFLYDSVYMWVVQITVVWLLVYFTDINVVLIYFISYITDLFKMIVGYVMVHKKDWVNNLVADI